MVELETLDIRTTTLGISLFDCADPDLESTCEKVYTKIVHQAKDLVAVADSIGGDYGVPIVNKRIAVTPISWIAAASGARDLTPLARAMDAAADEVGVDFVGGFSAYVEKGFTSADDALFESIPAALAATDHVCASVALASNPGRHQPRRGEALLAGRQGDRRGDGGPGRAGLRQAGLLLQPGDRQPLRRRRPRRHQRGRDGPQRRRLRSRRGSVGPRAAGTRGGSAGGPPRRSSAPPSR